MEPSPDISVVIPHFNQPDMLAKVLEDLSGQRGVALEAIVVDDASEDADCGDVVRVWQERGLPVSLARQPRRSYTLEARLRGMRQARGRWLAFIDADDGLCGPDVYARALEEAERSQTDILHYVSLEDKSDGFLSPRQSALPFSDVPLEGEAIFETWLANDCKAHSVWNRLYSRELYRRLLAVEDELPPLRPITRIEDFYLTAHFLFLARRYVPSQLFVYRYTVPTGTHLEKLAGRAIDALRMYLHLPGRLESLGLRHELGQGLRYWLRKTVTRAGGTMCRYLPRKPDSGAQAGALAEFDPEGIERILRYGSVGDFFLVLAIANASNARKLMEIASYFHS